MGESASNIRTEPPIIAMVHLQLATLLPLLSAFATAATSNRLRHSSPSHISDLDGFTSEDAKVCCPVSGVCCTGM